MSEIRQTLNEVLAGSKPPAAFLTAVDAYLAQPNANIAALRSLIDAAEHLGLPDEIANAARARLPDPDGVVGIGEPTRVAGSDDTTEIITPDATKVDIGDATEVTDDDAERTVVTTADAPTHLRADPADIDRTVFNSDPDRTEITNTDDATVQVGGDDPFAMSDAKKPDELGPGSVLKGRFRLEEVIGQGGMGAVYKAVDLLKVEARDRNPYMAVKLLVGDFKEHPEAFIALQRESAKAQRLAHPNIATVYDFDRDGETVYMTMELMVGVELAKYIKKLPAGGLPVPEAMRVIEQLCAGLQYAHARGLVHSDFKPGNAFLLDDGSVKLLDFGIARASKTKGDAEGESTVFDPGQLGALTPAYATIEMFEGQDPDPRDDIYALAAVSYELFTGKHPFNKMSAVKAKEKGLKPAPVDKLTKRQNRVLLKALALQRDDRCPSVEEFWENIKPRKDYTLQIAGGATAAVLLLGALLYNPVMNFIHEREYGAIVAEFESNEPARIEAALAQIDALPEERREEAAGRAQQSIIAYFQARADAATDSTAGRYDFPTALKEMDRLVAYFPDSNTVNTYREGYVAGQEQVISDSEKGFSDIVDLYEDLPANEQLPVLLQVLLPNPDAVDVPELAAKLRQANPGNEWLSSLRIVNAYATLAEASIAADDWQRANEILQVGFEASAGNPALDELRGQVTAELRRAEEAGLVATLRGRLGDAQPESLAEFQAVNADLQQLASLRPDDELAARLTTELGRLFDTELARLVAAADWAAADALLAEFAGALSIERLVTERTDLTTAQVAAGYLAPADPSLAGRMAAIRTLLADTDFGIQSARDLTAQFKAVTARQPTDSADWLALRDAITNAHIERAAALGESGRFRQAAELLAQGQAFHPDLPAFGVAAESLAAAERAYEAEEARRIAAEQIASAKSLVGRTAQTNPMEAAELFNDLRRQLGNDDPYIVTEGPRVLAEGFIKFANDAAARNDYRNAAQFAEAGLRVLPDSAELLAIRDANRSLAERATVVASIAELSVDRVPAFTRAYNAARESLPAGEATAFERDVVSALVGRLNVLNDDRLGVPLRAAVLDLFGGQQRQRLTALNLREPERPSQYASRIRALINERKLTEARTLLAEAQRAEPDHAQLRDFPNQLTQQEREATGYLTQARQSLAAGNRPQAQAHLTQAKQRWADGTDILDFERQNFQVTRGTTRADDGSKACTATLAGYGTRAQGRCNDVVEPDVPAPQLVVVPSPDGGAPFAIGRYEVTVEDFNRFCAATGSCQALAGNGNLPATGVSVQDVDRYLVWLTETTGHEYRLPTDVEWRHAANASGNPGSSQQYNCRVMGAGGNYIKGNALTNATAGAQNGWGLMNPVGNAQEWVRDGGQLRARGGAFEDSLTDCNVELVRAHSGAADGITGFRVVRGVE